MRIGNKNTTHSLTLQGTFCEMQGGAQPWEELRRLKKRQDRGGATKVWRRGAAAVPTGARKERRPWKPACRASSRQRCRHAAGHARVHAARAILQTTTLCACTVVVRFVAQAMVRPKGALAN